MYFPRFRLFFYVPKHVLEFRVFFFIPSSKNAWSTCKQWTIPYSVIKLFIFYYYLSCCGAFFWCFRGAEEFSPQGSFSRLWNPFFPRVGNGMGAVPTIFQGYLGCAWPPQTIGTWVEQLGNTLEFLPNDTRKSPFFGFGSLGNETPGLVSKTPGRAGISRVN